MDLDIPELSGIAGKRDLRLGLCTAPCNPPCKFDVTAFGLCNGHRMRAKRGQPIDKPLRQRRPTELKKTHQLVVWLDDEQLEGLTLLAQSKGFKSPSSLVLSLVEPLAKRGLRSKT